KARCTISAHLWHATRHGGDVMRAWALVILGALMLSGCDCSGSISGGGALCAATPHPAACGRVCSASNVCPPGFYCSGTNTCTADCSSMLACPAGSACSADGHFVP